MRIRLSIIHSSIILSFIHSFEHSSIHHALIHIIWTALRLHISTSSAIIIASMLMFVLRQVKILIFTSLYWCEPCVNVYSVQETCVCSVPRKPASLISPAHARSAPGPLSW